MPTYKNYKKRGRSNQKKMVGRKELDKAKRERLKRWITFFRLNPHIFIEEYFRIKLFPYQKLMIWMLQRSTLFYMVAARASAKSFMIGIWSMTLAVLYPGVKVIIASKTLKQAGIIISEKIKELKKTHPNFAREIEKITENANGYEVLLHNGSTIKAVVSNENSRGNRCNYLILDESRLVPKEILDSVLRPFLFSRTPPYLLTPEYAGRKELQEEGIITYITSAGWKFEYWYSQVKSVIKRMVAGDTDASFFALDYLITIFHNIKTPQMIRNESEDMDDMTKAMEYLNLPQGSSGRSYFKLNMFRRNIKRAFYPQRNDETYNARKNPFGIDKTLGEIRMVSADIATRAGKASDNTIISCIRLIPELGKGYMRQLVYIESHKGENTLSQAKRIKEIFSDFDADYIVLDLKNAGISIFDALSQITSQEERGVEYPAMTVVDDEFVDEKLRIELRERTLGVDPIGVIYPISATAQLNSDIAVAFRSSLQKKLWTFLTDDIEAEEFLIRQDKEFKSNIHDSYIRAFYLNPHVQTGLFVAEAVNLEMTLVSGNIKLEEPEGMYKDRYTSVSYGNWIVSSIYDPEILKQKKAETDYDVLKSVTFVR